MGLDRAVELLEQELVSDLKPLHAEGKANKPIIDVDEP